VYLRGYTGAIYTGEGWEELPVAAADEYAALVEEYGMASQEQGYRMMDMVYSGTGPILMDFYSMGEGPLVSRGNMTVEYVTANRRYVYAPYYMDPLEYDEFQYEQDGHFFSTVRRKEYEYSFLIPSLGFLRRFGEVTERNINSKKKIIDWETNLESAQYRQFSAAYREYVYQNYTQVKEEHEALKELLPNAALATVDGKIQAVLNYLSKYEYTLSPGTMPPDADFVNYFLFENKKGYCVHFASSAVLMLRSLGVPARYAEGYIITQGDINHAETISAQTLAERWEMKARVGEYELGRKAPNIRIVMQKRVEVRDYAAHAWVEVYLENLGWVPLEVTCGYTEDDGSGGRPEEIFAEVESLTEPTKIPEKKATPTPLPTDTPIPTSTPVPTKEIIPTGEARITKQPGVTKEPSNTPQGGGDTPAPTVWVLPKEDSKDQSTANSAWFVRFLSVVKPFAVVFLVLLLTGLMFFARYRIVWHTRQRRERKKQVLWYYAQMERILRRRGVVSVPGEGYEDFAKRVANQGTPASKEFAACQKMALYAGFGRGHISGEQAEFVVSSYGKMKQELFGECGSIRKYYLKFIKLY
nr:transglutaminase-like domain-containing protein [Lachnospiraceae bacterium]